MLENIAKKPVRRVVGMMSGTSVDGVDAALVEISGGLDGGAPEVKLLAFSNTPFPPAVREGIFTLFRPETATVDKVGAMNVILGQIYAQAALAVIQKAGLAPAEVDLIGSHGQTIWHAPVAEEYWGRPARYTVQIGEGSVIAHDTGLPTVSDFRVADMAAGGQGAPLVPFSEYLLYRRETETILLQNIGGIGNVTVMPAAAKPEEVYAFDTGPGNMIIDAVISHVTQGVQTYDAGGAMAAKGQVDQELLARLQQEPYYTLPLPKTTGRELFGTQYTEKILAWGKERHIAPQDLVATVTDLTAWSIEDACRRYVLPKHQATELIVGGGGSYNRTLLDYLARRLSPLGIAVRTQEDMGWNSDAKEAIAFALMADCCVREQANTLPSVTGAHRPAVMGKVSVAGR